MEGLNLAVDAEARARGGRRRKEFASSSRNEIGGGCGVGICEFS